MLNNLEYGNLNTAYGYVRLSREDGLDIESESISNQKEIIHNFASRNNINLLHIYVDDGYSGGNFDRPQFIKMIEDLIDNNVNCVITKDFSRLGRDHIETGFYIEKYFPEHRIRYISINDHYDSNKPTVNDSLLPLKLGTNEMVPLTASRATRSVFKMKQENNQYFHHHAPYGYKKNPKDKYDLIIDEEQAIIVKRIFNMFIKGECYLEIAEKLTEEKILAPINYRFKNDISKNITAWNTTTIRRIIKHPIYYGCYVSNTTLGLSYKTKKRIALKRDAWNVVENVFPPIIDKDTFLLANQIVNKKVKKYHSIQNQHDYESLIYRNKIFCKECGLGISANYDKQAKKIVLNCSKYKTYSKLKLCTSHYVVYEKVANEINKRILEKLEIIKKLISNPKILKEVKSFSKTDYRAKLKEIEKELKEISIKIEMMYADRLNGVINTETYKNFNQKINEKRKILELKKSKYLQLMSINEKDIDLKDVENIVNKYFKSNLLSKELINHLIDKIFIDKDRNIEIIYKFRMINIIEDKYEGIK